MRKYSEAIVNFMQREDGPTAVEYAVVLGMIIVVCVAAVAIVGTGASDIFSGASSGAGTTP
jgi:pilus assembly protein Flp/PilA